MAGKKELISNVGDLVEIVSAVFSDINIGLLIYHVEDPTDESSLRLIYANEEASEYTETDLSPRLDQYIFDAFPALQETELPAAFAEVSITKEAQQLGVVEYADRMMNEGAYSVKAFPLPANCVGVIFDDVAMRKQVEELVIKQKEEFEARCKKLSATLGDVLTKSGALKKSISKKLSSEDQKLLDEIINTAKQASRQTKA